LNTSILAAAIVALVLTAPIASAQDQAAPAQPAMGMGGDKGGQGDKGMMGGDMMKHHQMMQERMGMMTTMMQQMLDHLQAMESMPAK